MFTQPKSGFLGLNNDRFTMVFPDCFPEQDAQKLLDYLAKLLAEEAGENVTEVTANGRQEDSTETMTEEDDDKQSGTTNGFWDDV